MTEPIEQAQGGTEEPQASQGVTLAEADLPPELQGRSPEEVKMFVQRLPEIVAAIKEENETLKRGGAQPQDTSQSPPPAAQTSEDMEDLGELLKTDPEKAIESFIERRYGPVLQALDARVGNSEMARVANTIDDFHEYQEDIQQIIQANNLPMNEATIRDAYTYAVGRRALSRKDEMRRQEAESQRTLADETTAPKIEPLTDMEQTIARSMGLTDEEYRRYGDRDSTAFKVPGL